MPGPLPPDTLPCPDLTVEIHCLRDCVRRALQGMAAGEPSSDLFAGVSWPRLLWLARMHRLLPFLHAAAKLAGEACPADVLRQLTEMRKVLSLRRLFRAKEIWGHSQLLEREAVPSLSLDGWVLGELYYPDAALRETGDAVPYLISPEDRPRALQALKQTGSSENAPLEFTHLTRSLLEIRRGWLPPAIATRAGDEEGFQELHRRSVAVTIAGRTVRVPSATDWVLHFCSLIRPDAWFRLRTPVDLALACRHLAPEDWTALFARAVTPEAAGDLAVSLAAGHDLLGLDPPLPVTDRLAGRESLEDRRRALIDSYLARMSQAPAPSFPERGEVEEKDFGSIARYTYTPHTAVTRMLQLAGTGPEDLVCDLGSGDGRIVIAAARDFGARGLGVERDADWIVRAREAAAAAGVADRVSFELADAFEADIGGATVVALYCESFAYPRIRQHLRSRLRPGTRIVSHDLVFPGWPPAAMEILVSEPLRLSYVYCWELD